MSEPGGAPADDDTDGDEATDPTLREQFLEWWRPEDGSPSLARDLAISVGVVVLIGAILFAVSGVWPPLVAVESGSMEPNMHRGDLIFLVDEDRFTGDDDVGGVVPMADADGHEKFDKPGDVIIFQPNGLETETPVIHRAHLWVEEGDDWVEEADPAYLEVDSCEEVPTCPARHDGFITKGDGNPGYDQAEGGADTDVVKEDWITGKAMLRIPWLGYIRLTVDGILGVAVGTGTLAAMTGLALRGRSGPG